MPFDTLKNSDIFYTLTGKSAEIDTSEGVRGNINHLHHHHWTFKLLMEQHVGKLDNQSKEFVSNDSRILSQHKNSPTRSWEKHKKTFFFWKTWSKLRTGVIFLVWLSRVGWLDHHSRVKCVWKHLHHLSLLLQDTQTKIRIHGSRKKGVIVQADEVASNGMIHLINKLMDSVAPIVQSDTQVKHLRWFQQSSFYWLHEHLLYSLQENVMNIISDYGKFDTFKSLLQVMLSSSWGTKLLHVWACSLCRSHHLSRSAEHLHTSVLLTNVSAES